MGLGANGSEPVLELLGGHGLRASLGVAPQFGDSAAYTPQSFSRAQGISWHQAGCAGGKIGPGGVRRQQGWSRWCIFLPLLWTSLPAKFRAGGCTPREPGLV